MSAVTKTFLKLQLILLNSHPACVLFVVFTFNSNFKFGNLSKSQISRKIVEKWLLWCVQKFHANIKTTKKVTKSPDTTLSPVDILPFWSQVQSKRKGRQNLCVLLGTWGWIESLLDFLKIYFSNLTCMHWKRGLSIGLPLCEFQSKEVVSSPIRTVQILRGMGLKSQRLQAIKP